MEDNTENTDTNGLKESLVKLLDGASPERVQAATSLFGLSDEKAVLFGDALVLLDDTEYNLAILKQAVRKVKDESDLLLVRTRTNVRVFKYLEDEDNPDGGYKYRAFYVKTITPEQKIALGVGKADRLKEMIGGALGHKDFANKPEKIIEFLNSEAFVTLLTEPNRLMRKVVLENMVEVGVSEEGKAGQPFLELEESAPYEEFLLQELEVDLSLLIESQGVLAKNSLMTDM